MCALCGLRRRRIVPRRAGKSIGIGEIYAKSPTCPEVGPMERVVDYHVPPVETPLLRSLSLLSGLAEDALHVLDNLVRADRTLARIPWLRCIE